MAENFVDRDEAEEIIKEAIDDYLPTGVLQELLDLICDGEYIVVEEHDEDEDED